MSSDIEFRLGAEFQLIILSIGRDIAIWPKKNV